MAFRLHNRKIKSISVFNGYGSFVHSWAATWQNKQNECASSEDSDQPGHLPSLIRVFAVRMKKTVVLSYPLSTERRLWSDWAGDQADLSLRWAHSHFVEFVISWLGFPCSERGFIFPGWIRIVRICLRPEWEVRRIWHFTDRPKICWPWEPLTSQGGKCQEQSDFAGDRIYG